MEMVLPATVYIPCLIGLAVVGVFVGLNVAGLRVLEGLDECGVGDGFAVIGFLEGFKVGDRVSNSLSVTTLCVGLIVRGFGGLLIGFLDGMKVKEAVGTESTTAEMPPREAKST
mmetsp:Transcript_31618/g.43137  ORF Transcript_31618/g.43137 Transcript_31618/m.43137 type:complete len:114 (-) Transcript_31618:1036-1377(-)